MLEQTAVPGPAALRAGALPPTPTPAARALAAGDSSPVSLQGLLAAEGRWAVLFQEGVPSARGPSAPSADRPEEGP